MKAMRSALLSGLVVCGLTASCVNDTTGSDSGEARCLLALMIIGAQACLNGPTGPL